MSAHHSIHGCVRRAVWRATLAADGLRLSRDEPPSSDTLSLVAAPFLHSVYFAGALPSYPHRCLTPRLSLPSRSHARKIKALSANETF